MRRASEAFQTVKLHYLSVLKRTEPAINLEPLRQGYLETIDMHQGQLRCRGWYKGENLHLDANGISVCLERTVERADVTSALGLPKSLKTGFDISVVLAEKISLHNASPDHEVPPMPLELFSKADKRRALISTALFLPKLFAKHPLTVLKYVFLNDRHAAKNLELALVPVPVQPKSEKLDMSIFSGQPLPNALPGSDATIVLPVYNSFDLLKECLARVVTHTEHPYELIIVEDCSSDLRIRPWLRHWVSDRAGHVTLLINEKNLGFIGSVNRGIEAAKGHHVVLLNSDALVPAGWMLRLLAPIHKDKNVASTTPISNNAEILSIPVICKENEIPEGAVDRIDAIAKTLNGSAPSVQIPTGIGFCMALNKAFLKKVPALDRRFGKGYGEEVDWCQKTCALGGMHVAVTNLFVHHVGGESFGAEKQQRIAKNNAVISRLYPNFDQLVRDFSAYDPLHSTRVALGVAAIDIGSPVPIFLTHDLGGGTEVYVQNRIKTAHEKGQGSIVIRDDSRTGKYRFEIHAPAGIASVLVKDISEIFKLLAPLRKRAFIYSCMVGYRNPLDFMKSICEMKDVNTDTLTIQMHDFFPVCPSYNLLDHFGKFCNLPIKKTCTACFDANTSVAGFVRTGIEDWRNTWGRILDHSTIVEVFSNSSKNVFAKAYPAHKNKIRVNPHKLPAQPEVIKPGKQTKPVIGVLGNIGFNKGADFILKAAALSSDQGGKLIVCGKLDPKYAHKNIVVTGPYTVENLSSIARQNNVNCWLIPSVWPETFSYTTHEALATGLPVFAFDLGAQAEAMKRSRNGFIIKADPGNLFTNISAQLEIYAKYKNTETA